MRRSRRSDVCKWGYKKNVSPNDNDDKIERVPCVPQIRARMKEKSERNDLENAFECEHNDEQVLDLFLKRSMRTALVTGGPPRG